MNELIHCEERMKRKEKEKRCYYCMRPSCLCPRCALRNEDIVVACLCPLTTSVGGLELLVPGHMYSSSMRTYIYSIRMRTHIYSSMRIYA